MPFDVGGNILTNLQVKEYNDTRILRNNLVFYVDANIPTSHPGSGTTWTDLSGNGNNMSLINGPSYSTGYGNGSVYFDGSDDRGESTDSTSLSITSSITIIAWIYPTAATNSCGFIVKGNYNVYDWDYMFYISANSTQLVGYKKNSTF